MKPELDLPQNLKMISGYIEVFFPAFYWFVDGKKQAPKVSNACIRISSSHVPSHLPIPNYACFCEPLVSSHHVYNFIQYCNILFLNFQLNPLNKGPHITLNNSNNPNKQKVNKLELKVYLLKYK